jgi:hypothetical protein
VWEAGELLQTPELLEQQTLAGVAVRVLHILAGQVVLVVLAS